jgi:hypothetical protein
MIKFELTEGQTEDVRGLLKGLYEQYGSLKTFKDLGHKDYPVSQMLDVYKSYIHFVETVMGEINADFHKRPSKKDLEDLKKAYRDSK